MGGWGWFHDNNDNLWVVRKGVGKALMAQVMKEAMVRDLHSVYAYVRGDNKVGRKYLLYIVIHIPYLGCYPS